MECWRLSAHAAGYCWRRRPPRPGKPTSNHISTLMIWILMVMSSLYKAVQPHMTYTSSRSSFVRQQTAPYWSWDSNYECQTRSAAADYNWWWRRPRPPRDDHYIFTVILLLLLVLSSLPVAVHPHWIYARSRRSFVDQQTASHWSWSYNNDCRTNNAATTSGAAVGDAAAVPRIYNSSSSFACLHTTSDWYGGGRNDDDRTCAACQSALQGGISVHQDIFQHQHGIMYSHYGNNGRAHHLFASTYFEPRLDAEDVLLQPYSTPPKPFRSLPQMMICLFSIATRYICLHHGWEDLWRRWLIIDPVSAMYSSTNMKWNRRRQYFISKGQQCPANILYINATKHFLLSGIYYF